jgi:hypothetical protein
MPLREALIEAGAIRLGRVRQKPLTTDHAP